MDLLLDTSTGDLDLGADGRLSLTSTTAQLVAQRLSIKLDAQRGEWFLDETWGVRYLDDDSAAAILVKDPNIVAIVSEIKAIILDTEDVLRLTAFDQSYSASGRTLTILFTVLVEDGSVDVVVLMGDTSTALFDPEGSAFAVFNITVGVACPA